MTGDGREESPDRTRAGHAARNKALLERLTELGVRLEEPRLIDWFFWARDQLTAHAVAEGLTNKGMTQVVTSPPREGHALWSAQGQMRMSPTLAGSEGMTDALLALTQPLGAEYDGWGTAVDETATQNETSN